MYVCMCLTIIAQQHRTALSPRVSQSFEKDLTLPMCAHLFAHISRKKSINWLLKSDRSVNYDDTIDSNMYSQTLILSKYTIKCTLKKFGDIIGSVISGCLKKILLLLKHSYNFFGYAN